jgi:hypothetical protein
MFAKYVENLERRRRGIVLVLILAMLGLLALIGVTFATFSGQAQISARNFAISFIWPGSEQVMDFAMDQLVNGTNNPLSAIRGHEIARDMYGSDYYTSYVTGQTLPLTHGFLTARPDTGGPLTILAATEVNLEPPGSASLPVYAYKFSTNIPAGDPAFFGYDFTRWIIRAVYCNGFLADGTPIAPVIPPAAQTFEILIDNNTGNDPTYPNVRVFTVTSATPLNSLTILGPTTQYIPPSLTNAYGNSVQPLAFPTGTTPLAFTVDGRRLHAFNGPGMAGLNHLDPNWPDPSGVASNLYIHAPMYANFRVNGGIVNYQSRVLVNGNFVYTWGNSAISTPGNPSQVGMDEDYDACDLENWFLAIQSADGSVIIPSFHRPSILTPQDWTNYPPNNSMTAQQQLQANLSQAKILRPRQIENPLFTYPDPVPNTNTGQITYDVDNDGDGVTDSVWLDLGYPVQRDSSGRYFKPLYAFLIIGLNGRMPLNTAGNIQSRDSMGNPTWDHTSHIGFSANEVNPKYGLQNAFDPNGNGMVVPVLGSTNVINSQSDNVPWMSNPLQNMFNNYTNGMPITVAQTQLRNLLTGTRPQYNNSVPNASINGDANYVMANGNPIYLPNNIADLMDLPGQGGILRSTPGYKGRWGEQGSIPSVLPIPEQNPSLPTTLPGFLSFNNYIRAGRSPASLGWGDVNNGNYNPGNYSSTNGMYQTDGTDDDFDTFDMYPNPTPGNPLSGFPEIGISPGGTFANVLIPDFHDNVGGLLLPVERIRRFVTPIDPSGNGRLVNRNHIPAGPLGYGRGFDNLGRVSYFQYFRPPGVPGAIYPNPSPNPVTALPFTQYIAETPVIPDLTNNIYHGYEGKRHQRGGNRAVLANMPWDISNTTVPTFSGYINTDSPLIPINGTPTQLPAPYANSTLNPVANGLALGSLNRDEADEMNLYDPGPYDEPFSYSDLEWLYRVQEADGMALRSRLPELAPVSFEYSPDAYRRRRLFSTDSWELISPSWANGNANPANPNGQYFKYTNHLQSTDNGGLASQTNLNQLYYGMVVPPLETPSLAHRDRKINLNYPLPVSNDPIEPVRQKWILESYQLLKNVLPATSVDSPLELAQLSQFLVNVIDFRDPDCTITVFNNPDLIMIPGTGNTPSQIGFVGQFTGGAANTRPLLQYGMEYSPIAFNEAMAYQFLANQSATTPERRIMFELVNTLTRSTGPIPNNPCDLNLNGWQVMVVSELNNTLVGTTNQPAPTGLYPDYSALPDPVTGQVYYNSTYFQTNIPGHQAGQPQTWPLGAQTAVTYPPVPGQSYSLPVPVPGLNNAGQTDPNAFYLCSSTPIYPQSEIPANGTNLSIDYFFPSNTLEGDLPVLPCSPTQAGYARQFVWLYLLRPLNPFDPTNSEGAPSDNGDGLVVVDAIRVPYIEGGGYLQQSPTGNQAIIGVNLIYSIERFQPYRGGHLIPQVSQTIPTLIPPYAFGYSEQSVPSSTISLNYGINTAVTNGNNKITQTFYHTLGFVNDQIDLWDYMPFHDRDFQSVAELTLVPGCPPGLFTKQFVETAPPLPNNNSTAVAMPNFYSTNTISGGWPPPYPASGYPFTQGVPRTYPYLVDNFWYTAVDGFFQGAGGISEPLPPNSVTAAPTIGGWGSAGWHMMMEYFEVPSSANGAIGAVALGSNFDWFRQDTKPGLLNLNLIIDQEVFLGLIDDPRLNVFPVTTAAPQIVTQMNLYGYPNASYTIPVYSSYYDYGYGLAPVLGLTAAFTDFLRLRSGGSNYLFSYGTGPVGLNFMPNSTNLPFSFNPMMSAERPYRALSYPDIDFTVMRPAALPPSALTSPVASYGGVVPTTYNYAPPPLSFAASGNILQFNTGVATSPLWVADPGWKNPYLTWMIDVGASTGTLHDYLTPPPPAPTAGTIVIPPPQPPPIPPRRLFQVPDYTYQSTATGGPPLYLSNATELGNQYINQFIVHPMLVNTAADLVAQTTAGLTNIAPPLPTTFVPPSSGTFFLGGNGTNRIDQRTHPEYRLEWMQKIMNLTTVRTHQYAVWITVGFFEVTRLGNPTNINPQTGLVQPLPDQLGGEIDLYAGKNIRYRSFFVIDRTKITGFNDPYFPNNFHNAVVYSRRIE